MASTSSRPILGRHFLPSCAPCQCNRLQHLNHVENQNIRPFSQYNHQYPRMLDQSPERRRESKSYKSLIALYSTSKAFYSSKKRIT